MATNNFKPFATAANANVTAQADWESLPALLSGFTAGKASSAQINKALRQASFIAAALAQYTSDNTGDDVLDDGDQAAFIAKMAAAFGKDFQPLDGTLTALAALTGAADKLPYFNGDDTAALTVLTAFAREILAQTDAAGVLSKLRLGAGAPAIGIPFFWPSAAMPNTVMDEWSGMVFLKWNGATFSAKEYPKLALVIPGLRLNDVRGEFIRVWDDGRGVDIGRALLSAQESSKLHEHLGQNGSAPNYGYMTVASPDSVAWDNGWSVGKIPNFSSGSAGSNLMGMRPRNVAFNFLVRAK
ncbi:phage tail protein [Klebsiella sp. WP8-S18-ESBL-06]|uniref:phage tail protein n=1 Tax=Klebsiella sp. WP8-S18-ESBL-06 TaxID=2675726 RepID=UPI0015DD35F8|nr:phage tail protein [Klebsiella sp. WP8-S18-ESBL-06]BBT72359.1 tail fiber protein [Klebsiella sp. WP8-S18-ESBL-06]